MKKGNLVRRSKATAIGGLEWKKINKTTAKHSSFFRKMKTGYAHS